MREWYALRHLIRKGWLVYDISTLKFSIEQKQKTAESEPHV